MAHTTTSGDVATAALHSRSILNRVDLVPVVIALLVFSIVAPIGVLVYGALTDAPLGSAFSGLTLENFGTILGEETYQRAFLNTFLVGVLATAMAALLGILLAWIVVRSDVPWANALRVGIMIPFFISPFVGALAWTLLLQRDVGPVNMLLDSLGLGQFDPHGVGMIVWVMGIYYAPYMFVFVSSALHNVDPALEEAGHISGLNRTQVIRMITVPLVAPAVLSGALLTFIATAGQFGVPALLGMQDRFFVLATYIYRLINQHPADYNVAAALGVAMLLLACAGVWLQNRIMRGRSYATLTGKGFRPRIIELGRWRWLALGFVLVFICLGALLPLGMLAWVSLVPYYDATFSLSALSTYNYDILLSRSYAWRALRNTLFLATVGATIAVMLAVIANWIILRSGTRYRRPLEYLLFIPASVPNIVLSMALLWTYVFIPLPIYGTIWILLIAYVTCFITQAVRNVGGNYVQIDRSLEEAATMVGARRLRTWIEVTLPLLKPGMIGAWTLLFIIFVRELSSSILLYSPGNEVLPVLLFNMWSEGDWGGLSALAMIQVLMMGLVILLSGILFRVDMTKSQ